MGTGLQAATHLKRVPLPPSCHISLCPPPTPAPPCRPPPRSSQLYGKMVALARSCQQYGRFRDARTLLEAAGAHGELLALCVFQGDFQGLQAHARQVRRAGAGEGGTWLAVAGTWPAGSGCEGPLPLCKAQRRFRISDGHTTLVLPLRTSYVAGGPRRGTPC